MSKLSHLDAQGNARMVDVSNKLTAFFWSVGENIRPRGNDISKGACILKAGTLLGPAHAGLIASVGHAHVPVYRKLKVAMFSSGNESSYFLEKMAVRQLLICNKKKLL